MRLDSQFFFHELNGRSKGRPDLRLIPALAGAGIGLQINDLACGGVSLIEKEVFIFSIIAAALDFLEPVLVVLASATVGIHQRS